MGPTTRSDAYQITWLIRRLFRGMGQLSNKRLESVGITAADRAILEFLYPDRCLSVPAIAERYRVFRQHVQVTVNVLLERKLVRTSQNPRHKRSPLISLTNSGRELFAGILRDDAETIETWFSGISKAERKQVRRLLETLLQRLTTGEI